MAFRPSKLCYEVLGELSKLGQGLGFNVFDPVNVSSALPLIERPLDLTDYRSCVLSHLESSLFKKWEYLDLGIDKTAAALTSFREAEKLCGVTNGVVDSRSFDPDFWRFAYRVQGVISRILGDVPPIANLPLSLSKGATVDVGRAKPAFEKLHNNKLSTTLNLARGFDWESLPGYHGQLVPGSRVVTVPKNYKTDRTICVEPTLNGMVQRAYGKRIRRRLYDMCGLDLRTQQAVNCSLISSVEGASRFATIDFKAASDTVSRSLVKFLLPWEWYEALAATVCEEGSFAGETFSFEKFSSMGCGFTFELETLIFLAIAIVCGSKVQAVYGDDVIIERDLVTEFTTRAFQCGFEVNVEKSFSNGPFRESCGTDTYNGIPVSPFRCTKRSLANFEDVQWICNEAIRWFERTWPGPTAPLRKFRSSLLKLVPKRFRNLGPDGYGDDWFISNWSEAAPFVKRAKHGCEGFYVGCTRRRYEEDSLHLPSEAYAVYKASLNDRYQLVLLPPTGAGFAMRKRDESLLGSYRVVTGRALVRDWHELWSLSLD